MSAGSQVEECYSADGDPSMVHVRRADGSSVTVLGSPDLLTNDRLDELGWS